MKFLALVLALALEQVRPLRRNNRLYAAFERYADFLERQFKLAQNGTNVRTELIAGITTFLTMVYIIFVNPSI